MRELTVSFTNEGKAVVSASHNYQDEHCAARLAVTLPGELLAAAPDEYYLSFVRDADADNPMPQKITVGPVQAGQGGVLNYELPSSLTGTTCLAAQVEAVKYDAAGSVAALMKSPVFQFSLHPSLQGEEALPVTADADSLLTRLLSASSRAAALNQTLTEALEQGAFHARINGYEAVALRGGRNLLLTDENGTLTVDCTTLPIVTALPADPQEGDAVLLIPKNEITRRDSGMELMTGLEMLAAVARSEMQLMAQDPTPRCPLYLNLRKDGAITGFVSLTTDLEEDETGQENVVTVVSFVTKMRRNQPCDAYEIAFVNGTWSEERSVFQLNRVVNTLSTVPDSIRLPDFDTVESLAYEPIEPPVFFGASSLFAYKSRWLEIDSVTGDRQFHHNKATLDGFLCDALEAAAATPPGQPTVGLPYTGWDRLRWGDSEVRMAADGGVVRNVETVTHGGKSFLRLWLDYGEAQTIWQGMGTRPDYIDIPIDSATASTTTQGELTVNGTLLDLGVDSLASDSHTHANKSLLDGFGTAQLFTGVTIAQFQAKPICDTPAYAVNTNGYSGSLYAGAVVKLTQEQTAAVTIMGLTNTGNYQTPEYLLDFTTGATAPSLTLPASVEWADELTVEANKHYQISILDNVALWCAVDVEAVNE